MGRPKINIDKANDDVCKLINNRLEKIGVKHIKGMYYTKKGALVISALNQNDEHMTVYIDGEEEWHTP